MTTHYVNYYESEDRQCWDCGCGRSGSVGEFGDPEIHADKIHAKDGITNLGTTSRSGGDLK